MKPHSTIGKLEWLRHYLAVLLPFTLVLAVGALAHYYTLQQTEKVTREASELLNIGLARSALNSDLSNVISDLLFLSKILERQGLDPSGILRRATIEQLFHTFSNEKRLYDQIRFIDPLGREQIRINYIDGTAQPVVEPALQDKSSRYYFNEALKLGPGELYISPLDLNIEQGFIERPLKPVMRFAIPIFGDAKNRLGILVLNYLGERLIGNFARAGANIANHIHLLNADGYWLNSPDRSDEWGFMLPHGRRFPDRYPKAWPQIARGISGQFSTSEGLFSFETVTPWIVATQTIDDGRLVARPLPATASRWKVVARLEPGIVRSSPWMFIQQHLPLYLSITLLLLIGSWLLTLANIRHRRAEQQTAYERRFRRTLEDMQLVTLTLDRGCRVVFCNDYFLRLTGWQRDEIIGTDWLVRFIPGEQKSVIEEAFKRLESEQSFPREIETEILLREGRRRLIAFHNTPSLDVQGRLIGITMVGEDITERRQAEAKVKKLSHAVEQSPSTVLLTDRFGLIEYVNPKFSEVTGYRYEEVIGKKTNILKSGDTPSEVYEQLWKTVLSGAEWRGEFHNRRKNGELYWESASISALRGGDGEITNFVAVKEDITERKRLQHEVEERNRELARAQSLAAMGRMASMIAHDLRNPLSSVKMGMQILGKQVSNENKELAEIGLDQIRYMEEILTDMLAYAKPSAIKSGPVDIGMLLDTTLGGLQRRIGESGAEIHTDYEPELPMLSGDANKLRQLFSNLIVNALQSTQGKENHARVSIKAASRMDNSGTEIQVSISDNGIGLSAAEAEKLFEPFYTTRAKGTGLGLAIVAQIVDQHGGRITLTPRQEGGVCARVILPIHPPDMTSIGALR